MNKKYTFTVFYNHVLNAAKQQSKSLEEISRLISSIGISGVEMDYYVLKEEGDILAENLSSWGLPINSCYCFFDWVNKPSDDSYKQVLSDLARNGIKNLLVVPGFVDRKLVKEHADLIEYIEPDILNEAREKMLPNMRKLVELASEMRISVAMEDFDDITAPFANAAQVRWFLDRVPGLGCAFDTGNFLYSEEDALTALDLLEDRITYVHCKDRTFKATPLEVPKITVKGRKMYSSPVGLGVIPMKSILERCKKMGNSDTYAIEHFGSFDHFQFIRVSVLYLTDVFYN